MKVLISVLAIALSGATFAAEKSPHAHNDKPLHGGQVVEVNDMDFELVSTAGSIALYVRDHGKPVNLQGTTAKLTMLSGAEKSELTLTAGADGKLPGRADEEAGCGHKGSRRRSCPAESHQRLLCSEVGRPAMSKDHNHAIPVNSNSRSPGSHLG